MFLISPFDASAPSHPGTGSGWHGVSFLHSSPYGALFWICDYNGLERKPMFELLLNTILMLKACFAFLCCCPALSQVGWAWASVWEGWHSHNSWLNWPKGCSMQCNIMFSSKNWGRALPKVAVAQRPKQASICLWEVERDSLHIFVVWGFFPLSPLVIKVFLSQPTNFLELAPLIPSPILLWGTGWASNSVGA